MYLCICRSSGRLSRSDGYQPVSIQDDDEGIHLVSRQSRRKKKKSEPSLVLALSRTFWVIFLSSAMIKLVQDLLTFVNPQILK